MTKIKNWNGDEYTLDELLDLCKSANEQEIDFTEVIDNDLSTSVTIIVGLIERIKELESKA